MKPSLSTMRLWAVFGSKVSTELSERGQWTKRPFKREGRWGGKSHAALLHLHFRSSLLFSADVMFGGTSHVSATEHRKSFSNQTYIHITLHHDSVAIDNQWSTEYDGVYLASRRTQLQE